MIFNKLIQIYFILPLIFGSNFSYSSSSKEMTLVGEIISFDKTHLRIKSGNQEYLFSKEELDHPSYTVGKKIEILIDDDKINHARVKKVNSIKK